MARGDIRQTIRLEGGDQVISQLAGIGRVGEDAFRRTSDATARATVSSGAMRAALTNLSFQVNDVATSLASGGDAARVFAQQGGQIFQAVQQGGGLSSTLSAVGTSIAGMITPMRAAVVGGAALVAGFALIIARAIDARDAAKDFNIVLAGVGKTGALTGKDLVEAASRLRDVGLSAGDARTALTAALRQGVNPAELERVVRTGQQLNRVFGEGTLEEFISAVGKGGEPLRQFAERMGLVPKKAEELAVATSRAGDAIEKETEQIKDALRKRNEALADIERSAQEQRDDAEESAQRQREDLAREHGTAEEEIALATSRRLEEIDERTARRRAERDLKDARDRAERVRDRNREAATALAEFNRQIDEAAEKAAAATRENARLFDEIARKAASLDIPLTTIQKLSRAWGDLLDVFANSSVVQGLLDGLATVLTKVATALTELLQGENTWGALAAAIGLVGPAITTLTPLAVRLIGTLGVWKSAVTAVGNAWNGLKAIAQEVVDGIKEIWGDIATWFNTNVTQPILTLISQIRTAWQKLKDFLDIDPTKLIDAAGKVTVGGQQLAAGGRVHGPGTATSDSIPARLSAGEYVVNAFSTARFLPLLEAINSLRGFAAGGLVPRGLGFAAGGLAPAGGGGSPIYLQLPGGQTLGPMSASRDVTRQVFREVRLGNITSAGKAPSWRLR